MIKPKLSYANVAATLALVFSMTGGAMAAHHYLITSTKQISPKVVKALKGKTGKAGPAGPQGIPGKDGAVGKEGKEGKEGMPGAAVAYAHIEPNGTLDASESKNIAPTNVVREGTGFYCFKNLPFTVKNVQATIDYNGTSNGENLQILTNVPGTEICEGPGQAGVFIGKVISSSSTIGVDTGFYVMFN